MSESNLQPTQMSGAKQDERKPVICPNCKAAMQCVHDAGLHNGPQHWYQFACDCGVSTPWEDTVEAAYAAATQRPPNRATENMSTEELCALLSDGSAIVESCVDETHRRTGEYSSVLIESGDSPNRALTREQVEAMDDLDAVWIAPKVPFMFESVRIHAARWVKEQLRDPLGAHWAEHKLLFACRPTPADIEAARKECADDTTRKAMR